MIGHNPSPPDNNAVIKNVLSLTKINNQEDEVGAYNNEFRDT